MTYYSGTLLGPGQVKHPGSGLTHLGELSGGLTPRVEAVAAMFRAAGIAPAYDERRAAITGLLQKAVSGKASMLHDVQAVRKTEIEVINGAIVAAGKKAGVATPVNQRQWCR